MSTKQTLIKSHAQPPVRQEKMQRTPASSSAGGVKAVVEALKHGMLEMGPVRTGKTLLKVNQPEGFDCPGCAWPEPKERSQFEFCENGAKAVAEEATLKRVGPRFFKKHSIAELGAWTDYELGRSGRLTQPMVLEPDQEHYQPISWDEAFKVIGEELNYLQSPDEAVFYTSGRTSNEAAFLYQLFVRKFGTNNMPDCSNMCHESSGTGMVPVIGIGKGTVTLEDFEKAGAIFVLGQNPGTNHPRMLSALRDAKANGAKIVSVNPLKEVGLQRFTHPQKMGDFLVGGRELTDLYLQVRINGDVALLKGIMKALLEAESSAPGTVLDKTFIQNKTADFDAFASDIQATSWEEITEESGLLQQDIVQAAQIYSEADGVILCWAMGLTQHVNGVANIQSCLNLLLMGGNIGKPGAGACPVRGHSNVQGDRTMGIWEAPPKEFLDRLQEVFQFDPPREHGLAVVPAIEAMQDKKVKVFIGMGGNFISATPDTEYTAQALKNSKLTVQISTKLNRSHLITGTRALILPCLGRTEIDEQKSGRQFVTVENSMGIVHRSQGHLSPASKHLRSEPAIVAAMATAVLGAGDSTDWAAAVENYNITRDLIEECIPGFENFNKRVKEPHGFALPNEPREGRFPTPSGKAHFTVHPIAKHDIPHDHFLMMTIRSHDQYNTTIYGLDDRYRGILQVRRVVLINVDDMAEHKLQAEDIVDIHNNFGERHRVAQAFKIVPYDIPRGCIATYFPETNVLVPINKFAKKSLTPASKSVVVWLEKSQ